MRTYIYTYVRYVCVYIDILCMCTYICIHDRKTDKAKELLLVRLLSSFSRALNSHEPLRI